MFVKIKRLLKEKCADLSAMQKAQRNTSDAMIQAHEILKRIGMDEWIENRDKAVSIGQDWLLLIPVIERLLTRIEELEKRQVRGVDYTKTQSLPKR